MTRVPVTFREVKEEEDQEEQEEELRCTTDENRTAILWHLVKKNKKNKRRIK